MTALGDSSVATLLALLAACSAAPDDDWDLVDDGKSDRPRALTYGELARGKVPPALAAAITGLAVIDADVMPHEPKPVRKQLATLRDQVDLFVYAYPTRGGDPWQDIRDDLDDGYETIGAFKDLFDRQGVADPRDADYDPDELADRRAEVIAWTTDFLDEDLAGVRAYLAAPAASKLYDRDRDDLSPFFWGATRLTPSKSKSGLKNMARLAHELLDLALDDHDRVLALRDLHKVANQAAFHDYRKRLRSLARLPGYFPELLDPDDDITAELELLTEAVDRFGALNDLLTRYAADPDGDLKDEIAGEWKALRDWIRDRSLEDALALIDEGVRKA
jgi:hypothetical protein